MPTRDAGLGDFRHHPRSTGFPVTLKSNDDNSLQGSIPNGVNNYSLDIGRSTGPPAEPERQSA